MSRGALFGDQTWWSGEGYVHEWAVPPLDYSQSLPSADPSRWIESLSRHPYTFWGSPQLSLPVTDKQLQPPTWKSNDITRKELNYHYHLLNCLKLWIMKKRWKKTTPVAGVSYLRLSVLLAVMMNLAPSLLYLFSTERGTPSSLDGVLCSMSSFE